MHEHTTPPKTSIQYLPADERAAAPADTASDASEDTPTESSLQPVDTGGPRSVRGWTRRKHTRWTALACLVLVPAVFLALTFRGGAEKNALSVALIMREENAISEQVIRAGLEDLIREHNSRSGAVPLKLQVFVSELGKKLNEHLGAIAVRDDIVAVIDNSWGVELAKGETPKALERLDRAVVFLNGDRNSPLPEPPDRPWVFLGASDHIPFQLKLLMGEVQRVADSAPTVCFIEQAEDGTFYAPAVQTLELLGGATEVPPAQSASETKADPSTAPITKLVLPCAGSWQLPNRNALIKARSELLTAMPNHTDDSRKIVVLYTHASWGSELARWIDSTFRNTTIVAYQSALSRDRLISLREETGNELVLLSQSATAAPRFLVEMHGRLRSHTPDVFTNQSSDIFFLRRAVVAFGLVEGAVRGSRSQIANVDVPEVRRVIAERAAVTIGGLKRKTIESRLGLLAFDQSGVERGNNHIVLRYGGSSDSYPLQLGEEDRVLPNLQLLLSHVRVLDLDIRQGTMRVSLILHVRFDTDAIIAAFETQQPKDVGPGAATLTQRLDSILERLLRFGSIDEVDFTQRLLTSRSLGRLTEHEYAVSGTCRLRDMDPWWYPFDTHTVRLPLHILEATDRVRVSVDQRQRAALETSRDAEVAGWSVMEVGVTIDHQATDVPRAGATAANQAAQAQFSTVDLGLVLRRRPWSASLLVYLPLFLISAGSTAVLFIQLGESTTSSVESDTRKTQSELCLGCVLAVVTYLISYAGLVPRLERPLYCDLLLGTALVIVSCNFIFVVAVADRRSNAIIAFLNMRRYRIISGLMCAFAFGIWLFVGFS